MNEYRERCANCIALIEHNERWYCDISEDYVEEVEQCPEGIVVR